MRQMKRTKQSELQKQKIIVYGGGAVLLLLMIGSWVPRDCPLIRQVISPCPGTRIANSPETSTERDIARIPHQVVDRDLVEFSAKAQEYRKTTELRFSYRGKLDTSTAYLAMKVGTDLAKEPNGTTVVPTPSVGKTAIEKIALVTHPLLFNLNWSRYTSTQPNVTMYQRNERYIDIAALQQSLPPAKELAVDSIIAKRWNLDYTQYTPFDDLTNLNGINYVITSFTPPTPDGVWLEYRQTFDLQQAYVNKDGMIEGMLILSNVRGTDPSFLLSSVGIDYRSLK